MKTTAFSTAVLSVLFAFAALTLQAKPAPKKSPETPTQKTIRHYFKFPSVLSQPTDNKEHVTTVEVLYTTDNNGRVNFVIAKTEDLALKTEIEKQFYALTFNEMPADVVHKMILNFKFI